jgi:hypothetical protein
VKVYVLIEFTGNAHEVDGAVIHGVFADYDDAREAQNDLPGRVNCEIEEHTVVE